ncbi:gephyrin-like molybdotransferase Glp [Ruminiclostridium cellulolyticum]|uniref:Molybdopterin molybdenumtransferase n=1 Tax=Ruminiclostridium cellulolyticum (strain ATCC 35319 / DSM 5812 / JCM 6584 / H10) TaxID=394503 RepID=B8I2G5_RUMCH|nr:gephyrin-like molybdotransferase Glp [Ruminiclostridium cellulolyticum]ACL75958.1 molybdenum cofactor synthesis domain protein [Ruminiclostridium cellulolyticum H10]
MLGIEQARDLVLESVVKKDSEVVDITSSLNRILACDLYSDIDLPTFNNSAMDGYAVISSELKGASFDQPISLEVIGEIPAGYTYSGILMNGKAIKIMTGAPIPQGADAVVPIEYTKAEGALIKVFRGVKDKENIRYKGEDLAHGKLVLKKGKKLSPADIGMLAAQNLRTISVSKLPSVSILATGDEVVDVGEELSPGKIRDINSYTLYANVIKYGGIPISLGIAKDNKDAIIRSIENGLNSDILVISGGVSVGDYDFVKEVLIEKGVSIKFWKVAIKPGKPILFGVKGNTLVFGLPGNPISTLVTFREFVLPAMCKMQGRVDNPVREQYAVLERDIAITPGRRHYFMGNICYRDGSYFTKPVGIQSSGALNSMLQSNCLIVVPEDTPQVKSGEQVLVQLLDE